MTTDRFQSAIFVQTVSLFGAAFVLAYMITVPVAGLLSGTSQTVSGTIAEGSPGSFLLAFAVVTIIALLLVKNLKNDNFWKVFFGLGAFAGLFITIMYLALYVSSVRVAYVIALVGAIVLLVARQKTRRIWLHNLVIILSVVGVARLFGFQFSPKATAIILAVLALYDIFSVYLSKHMVQMARTLFDRQAFFGLIIPQQFKDWRKGMSQLQPGENVSAIGAGDVALPLFFALSHLFHTGIMAFWIITAFVMLGVVALHSIHVFPARRKPMPALPPLVLCAFIGHWLVGLL